MGNCEICVDTVLLHYLFNKLSTVLRAFCELGQKATSGKAVAS